MTLKPTMLIVDDELDEVRDAWGDWLADDYGWDVSYADGYDEAIAALESAPPAVVLLDRQMPDPKTGELGKHVGDELLEVIVARWPDVCPIMLTHNADYSSAKRDTRRGAWEYFDKRVTHKDLDAACRRGLRWIQLKLCREKFIGLRTMDDILSTAASSFSLEGDDFSLAFVEVTPTGAFVLRRLSCHEQPQNITKFIAADESDRKVLREVMDSKRARIFADSQQLSTKTSLTPLAAVRVIVPVMSCRQLNERMEHHAIGLLWIEGATQESLDREDAEMAGILANYVAEAVDRFQKDQQLRLDSREDTRKWLLATTVREICAPLQAAQSDLDLLSSRIITRDTEVADPEFVSQLLQVKQSLEDAVQAAVELRNDLREVELNEKPLDLPEIVRDRCESFRSRALAANCVLDPKPEGWRALSLDVKLDRVQMRYALDCMLENSLEAIEEQRRRRNVPDLEGRIVVRIAVDAEGRDVLLSIVDNGSGIDREHLPKVFDRYFTTKESTLRDGNSSMGLSQVKRLVEACGGEIEACNAPKGGAEFTLWFPVVQSGSKSRGRRPSPCHAE